MISPRYVINPLFCKKIHKYFDCIVIGSGIAGLSTAIRISKHMKVKVLTKSMLSDSTTWFAQGGIAAAIKKPDKWENHYDDTIEAGQGLCDRKAVKNLVKNAPRMIEDLIELGINFDILEGEISLTTEGGHSYPRILHAGGDATGEEIEKKLVNCTKNEFQINFSSEYFVLDILTDNKNNCIGVIGLNTASKSIEIYPASNVIIASGGIGHLYELTTNPSISTGDGIAMAYRAGVSIKDIEFIQFHPTVFKTNEGKLFLITEALRGEGAYLRNKDGKRFMLGKHPRAELAPRDIVVKEMVKVMQKNNTEYIFLDATHLPLSMLKIRFPNILSKLRENGLDLKNDLIKVFPAAHYLNGGIKTNQRGQTENIKGLYACGEAAATGAHGANRLASNSLIEGLVYGCKIYNDITSKKSDPASDKNTIEAVKKLISCRTDNTNNKHKESSKSEYEIENLIDKFRHVMSKKVGILRDKKSLKDAQDFIDLHLHNKNFYNSKDKNIIEFVNMLTVAGLIIKSASLREESRGTHQRNDFPKMDNKHWKKHIILKKDKFHFEPVG